MTAVITKIAPYIPDTNSISDIRHLSCCDGKDGTLEPTLCGAVDIFVDDECTDDEYVCVVCEDLNNNNPQLCPRYGTCKYE